MTPTERGQEGIEAQLDELDERLSRVVARLDEMIAVKEEELWRARAALPPDHPLGQDRNRVR